MVDKFYRQADPHYSIVESMKDSLRFATRKCLDVYQGNLCGNSTFVTPNGEPQLWHDFGGIEGVGWAANLVGGAYMIGAYANRFGDQRLRAVATSLLYHALEGGFFREDGFVYSYRETQTNKYFLNYRHKESEDHWFCPGSIAHVCLQLFWASDGVEEPLKTRLRQTALKSTDWLRERIQPTQNGWYPRRVKPDGSHANYNSYGDSPDAQWDNSGDGTYLLWLWNEVTARGYRDCRKEIERAAHVYRDIGGAFGSINHDTYDDHENVAYSVGYRCLARVADTLRDTALYEWALSNCLHGLEQFEMKDNRNGVETRGLLYMEKSWPTAYLWENAEAALALFEAAKATRIKSYELKGLTILRTAAMHHYGDHGFLTEGVDWSNHVGQYYEKDGQKIPLKTGDSGFGAINFTEPFLNNMHIAQPTLFYLEHLARRERTEDGVRLLDLEGNELVVCQA